MPNWVYNSLLMEGPKEDINKAKEQLNKPFSKTHDSWSMETNQMELKETMYSKPIFAFHNIYNHIQDGVSEEDYMKQPDHTLPMKEALMFKGNHWYDWNVRNWGTKWDVAKHDTEEYSDTDITIDTDDTLGYRFNTAWSPPIEAITKLSEQYPNIKLTMSYQEETGWGGEIVLVNGETVELTEYQNVCRDCDSIDTLEYCEEGCGEICDDCHYLGEADLDCVAECDIHKVYLDKDHVPDYRMDEIND